MPDREKVIEGLRKAAEELARYAPMKVNGRCQMYFDGAIYLLKKQEAVVRCKDCKYWVPGVITDQDDFIPPKCGKYSQMVGHSADDFCSFAEQEVKWDG